MKNNRDPMTIYAIRCKANGKMYIGRTADVQRRADAHLSDLRGGRKKVRQGKSYGPSNWQKDYEKFGEDSFELFVLEENVPYNEGQRREKHWINEYHSNDPNCGYNLTKQPNKKTLPVQKGLPPKKEMSVCEK